MRYSKVLMVGLVITLSITALPKTLEAQSNQSECEQTGVERTQKLSLDYKTFDQTPGAGYRAIADRGCYELAANLILEYITTRVDSLTNHEIQTLYWHAGQMYAYADEYDQARIHFLHAIKSDKSMEEVFPWNAYVKATIAFLDGNLTELQKQREHINSTITRANLQVVDSLIENFGQPYRKAYAATTD